jgi:hypothetical protein
MASLSTVQILPVPLTVMSPLSPSGIPVAEALIVIASVVASVVIEILVPATRVRVSEVVSATTLDCPETAIVPNRFWSPVLVPEDVPLNVPSCVANVPKPRVALWAEASTSSSKAKPAAVGFTAAYSSKLAL